MSYPDPNAAQNASPFYQTTSAQDAPNLTAQDQDLTAALARALNASAQGQNEPQTQSTPAFDLEQQLLAQGAIGHLDPGQEYEDFEDEVSDGGTHHKRKKQRLSPNDASNRQKNTRACDECRRKKVKCESEIGQEFGIEACLACKKSGLQCQFSRVPQKRGPSKGYISKLDERLQNVENAIREYVPQAAHRIGRPEAGDSTYDMSFADDAPQAQSGAHTDHGLLSNGGMSSIWNHTPHRSATLPDLSAVKAAIVPDLDEIALNQCYDCVQATLPILASDPLNQQRRLAQASPATRAAFVSALNCFVRAIGPGRASVTIEETKTAAQLCLEADFESASKAKTLILIQTYIILSLAAEELGPLHASCASATSSQKLLSQANNLALGLNLHRTPTSQDLQAGLADTDVKIGRRLFVSLYIIDRWLAVGYAAPFRVNITADKLTLLAEDRQVLGEQCYQLARVSTVLTSIMKSLPTVLAAPASTPTSPEADLRGQTADLLQILVDRVADDFASFAANVPVLHAAFLHAELLVYRLRPITDFATLTDKAVRMLKALDDTRTSPLYHHFAALAGLTIVELALRKQENKTLASATPELEHELSIRSFRQDSWEQAVLGIVQNATAVGQQDATAALRSLADAAVTGAIVQALLQPKGFDMAKLVGEGYLTMLVPKS